MKASELVAELELLIAEYGDLECIDVVMQLSIDKIEHEESNGGRFVLE